MPKSESKGPAIGHSVSRIEIRKAAEEDISIVSEILTEAAEWLISRGEKLWEREELRPVDVAKQVEAGMFRIAECEGRAAGCYRFQESDDEYWGDVPHPDSAFIHRVAVRRAFAGKGVSTVMIRSAMYEARGLGRRFLRLDCRADRDRLRAVYERHGFVFHSLKEREPYTVARYEIEV